MNYFEYDQEHVNHLIKHDPLLGAYIQKIGMIKRAVNPDIFNALVSSVVSQQISLSAAKTVFERLTTLVGEVRPESILEHTDEQLQACGMSFRKVNYLKSCASAFVEKKVTPEMFHLLSDEEIIEQLVTIYGVGKWTAQMLLIFSLQRKNVISYDDLMIRKGMESVYQLESITKKQFNEIIKAYDPYCSVASIYLWEISHL